MKLTTLPSKLFSLVICLALMGGLFSIDANAQGVFQKRKYRKGFYIDFGKAHKSNAKAERSKSLSAREEIEIEVKPTFAVEEQAYELPFQDEQQAYENVEAPQFASAGEETKERKTSNFSEQLGVKTDKNERGIAQKQVEKWNRLKEKLDPNNGVQQEEASPYLRKALVLALIGLIFLLVAGLLGASWGLGWLFWAIGSILMVIALVFFVLWIVAAA